MSKLPLPSWHRGTDEPDVVVDINTTPLIDVMLVLLIMLIITIPMQTHAVRLDLPQGNPPESKPPTVVNVVIGADDKIEWNGQALLDRKALDAEIVTVASQPEQPEIHIYPDKDSQYKMLAAVMADAQRLGLNRIGIVGNEQFLPP